MKMDTQIRPISQDDQTWIVRKLTENWGAPLIISRGIIHNAIKLPGFVVLHDS